MYTYKVSQNERKFGTYQKRKGQETPYWPQSEAEPANTKISAVIKIIADECKWNCSMVPLTSKRR